MVGPAAPASESRCCLTVEAGGGGGARLSSRGDRLTFALSGGVGFGAFVSPSVAVLGHASYTTSAEAGSPGLAAIGGGLQWWPSTWLMVGVRGGLAGAVGHIGGAEPHGKGVGYAASLRFGWAFIDRPHTAVRLTIEQMRVALRDGYATGVTVLGLEWQHF